MWANHKIDVDEANEARRRGCRVVRPRPDEQVGAQRPGHRLQPQPPAVLTIILVHRDEGGYYGANGWESNSSGRRRYERGE